MFKVIRRNPLVNKFVRNILKRAGKTQKIIESKWRLSGVIELVHNQKSFQMYSECDDGILNPLFYGDDYIETNDLKVFTKLIMPGDVIFDIGANTGLYSVVSGVVSNDATIYAFEPNVANLKRLSKNIELNSLSNITIIPFAVGNTNEDILFTVLKDDVVSDTSSAIEAFSKSTYRGELEWKNISVAQIRVDDFVESHNISKIDLMKVDVEGYEIEVLKGAMQSILCWKPTILLETFLDGDKRSFLEVFVREAGYTVYLIFKEGIVKTGGNFESNTGLNYLLMSFETEQVFTKISEVKRKAIFPIS